MHFAYGDAVEELRIASEENQVGLEVDFRNGFSRLEGLPDALEGPGISDVTYPLFALSFRKVAQMRYGILALSHLHDFDFARKGL